MHRQIDSGHVGFNSTDIMKHLMPLKKSLLLSHAAIVDGLLLPIDMSEVVSSSHNYLDSACVKSKVSRFVTILGVDSGSDLAFKRASSTVRSGARLLGLYSLLLMSKSHIFAPALHSIRSSPSYGSVMHVITLACSGKLNHLRDVQSVGEWSEVMRSAMSVGIIIPSATSFKKLICNIKTMCDGIIPVIRSDVYMAAYNLLLSPIN